MSDRQSGYCLKTTLQRTALSSTPVAADVFPGSAKGNGAQQNILYERAQLFRCTQYPLACKGPGMCGRLSEAFLSFPLARKTLDCLDAGQC